MDYKSESREATFEDQLLPRIAKAVGVPVSVLVDVGYQRDGADVLFRGKLYTVSFDVPDVGEEK